MEITHELIKQAKDLVEKEDPMVMELALSTKQPFEQIKNTIAFRILVVKQIQREADSNG